MCLSRRAHLSDPLSDNRVGNYCAGSAATDFNLCKNLNHGSSVHAVPVRRVSVLEKVKAPSG